MPIKKKGGGGILTQGHVCIDQVSDDKGVTRVLKRGTALCGSSRGKHCTAVSRESGAFVGGYGTVVPAISRAGQWTQERVSCSSEITM